MLTGRAVEVKMNKTNIWRRRVFLSLCVLLCACASNPVTHQSQLMLISEEKEIRIGEEAAKKVKEEYGYYDDLPGLNQYVSSVGEKLVAQSARSELIFHFQVLNTPVINAFALPGGYVYITRGIMARLNAEDDLASVLGHEITHVAARHSAAAISKAYAAQTTMILASILAPGTMNNFGDLTNIALNLAFLGYSRSNEAQADEYGITYMIKAGYNPQGAVDTFLMFKGLEEKEPGRMERFLLSHPPTAERLAYARSRLEEARKTSPSLASEPLRRNVYLQHINGLLLGQSEGEKVIADNVFYQKHYGVCFTFPDSYSADLRPKGGEVILTRDKKEGEGDSAKKVTYIIGFEINPLHKRQEVRSYIEEYLKATKGANWDKTSQTIKTADGHDLAVATVDLSSTSGTMRALTGFLVGEKEAYVLYGITRKDRFDAARPEFAEVLHSLRFPPAEDIAKVKPPTLRLVTTNAGDTWQAISQREFGCADFAAKLASYNGFFEPGTEPPAGTLIKIPTKESLATAK